MGHFSHALAFGIAAMVASSAASQEDPGVRLSGAELASFLPGTKAVYVIKAGSIHRWTNEPNGKFVASTDAKTVSMTGRSGGTARGSWHISDEGRYCVNIDWRTATEDWCRFVYRTNDGGYYMTGSDDPAAERRKIEFSK